MITITDSNSSLLKMKFTHLIPKLTSSLHKGQCGRLAIIGGCQDYTGAPYFSGIAALSLGCDLVHIVTTVDAAGVIKGYSPDLMTHPYLYESHNDPKVGEMDKCLQLLDRMDAVVIGPGLGRDLTLKNQIGSILKHLHQSNKPLVLDADALFHLSEDKEWMECIKNYTGVVVLTPNVVEFGRLTDSSVEELSDELQCCVIQKGEHDLISFRGKDVVACQEKGSMKRVGGQGDTLTGVLGTMLCWDKDHKDPLAACYGACAITRRVCKYTWEKHGRSMLTSQIHLAMDQVWQDIEHDKFV